MGWGDNEWEAVPWDASDEIVDMQLRGFKEKSAKPIRWHSIRNFAFQNGALFGLDREWYLCRDVEFYAEHDGEHLLLIRSAWHGFPDPPEWGLASRMAMEAPWSEWGHFSRLPTSWRIHQIE